MAEAHTDIRDILSGKKKGFRASLLRGVLRCLEPAYASAMRARNVLYQRGIKKTHRLPRPVISIGNITTGGTGKTPMVRWLASHLHDAGKTIAILSRGYKAQPGELGDELSMLHRQLNENTARRVTLIANPDRVAGGKLALQSDPSIDLFLLDDGFQHRRLHRDLDIVLISAMEPFGFDHVLPRGLLREPMSGLQRADAFILTHTDRVPCSHISTIEQTLRRFNASAPILHTVHAMRSEPPPAGKWFAFCGIGNPDSFRSGLTAQGIQLADFRSYPDHHAFSEVDWNELNAAATSAGAVGLVTTEKDWVKLAPIAARSTSALPVRRVDVEIQFLSDDASQLLNLIDAITPPG